MSFWIGCWPLVVPRAPLETYPVYSESMYLDVFFHHVNKTRTCCWLPWWLPPCDYIDCRQTNISQRLPPSLDYIYQRVKRNHSPELVLIFIIVSQICPIDWVISMYRTKKLKRFENHCTTTTFHIHISLSIEKIYIYKQTLCLYKVSHHSSFDCILLPTAR